MYNFLHCMILGLSRFFFWYAVDLESCRAPLTLTSLLNLTTNMCVFFCFPNHLTGRWGGKLGSGWKLYLILQTVCKLSQSLEHERICFSFRPASFNDSGCDLGIGRGGNCSLISLQCTLGKYMWFKFFNVLVEDGSLRKPEFQEKYLLCVECPCPTQLPSQVCHKIPWAWMVK